VRLAFLFVGGAKGEWILPVEAEYAKKIGRFAPIEIVRLKPPKLARPSATEKKAREGADILKALKPDDLVVACDERGEQVASREFSQKLVRLFERGRPRVAIVVGGPYGLSEEVLARADWRWSLSRLTFSHPLAQAVALEQAYRALTIWKGIPYHND
jgi:23S rRNA (pseudouridine1915-N3)-methyltransferase